MTPTPPPVVIKIGGSVLRGADDYITAARALVPFLQGGPTWAVVSAARGVTDELDRLARDPQAASVEAVLHRHEVSAGSPIHPWLEEDLFRSLDEARAGRPGSLRCWGERASADVLQQRLSEHGLPLPIYELTSRRKPSPQDSGILPGFYVRDRHGRARSLQRGGSDISALILAVRVGAPVVRLWKEGGGLYADGAMTKPLPRIDAVTLLARLGPAIRPIHPAAVRIAHRHRIELLLESPDGSYPSTRVIPDAAPGPQASGPRTRVPADP